MKNVAVLTEVGAFALFFRPIPGGFGQPKSPHTLEIAFQGEKNANDANARGEGGGGVWAQLELTKSIIVLSVALYIFELLAT